MNAQEETHQYTPRLFGKPLAQCPTCRSAELEPVVEVDTGEVHFRCHDCGRCWHVELGYVHRVSPRTCHGCPSQPECEAVYARDAGRPDWTPTRFSNAN
jgi:hypothetical protein